MNGVDENEEQHAYLSDYRMARVLEGSRTLIRWIQGIMRDASASLAITNIAFAVHRCFPSRDLLDVSLLTSQDWSCLAAAIKPLCASEADEEEWLKAMRIGYWDAFIGATLPRLVHLQELELFNVAPFSIDDDPVHFLLKAMASVTRSQLDEDETQHLLPNLRFVKMVYGDTEYGFEIADFLPFVAPKSVTEFQGYACANEGWQGDDEITLSLTKLELQHSCLDMQSMSSLISCCPKLESLDYECGGTTVGLSTMIPSELARLWKASKERWKVSHSSTMHLWNSTWRSAGIFPWSWGN